MSKTPITALAGYPQSITETAINPNNIFKYSHSNRKHILRLEHIKKNNIFPDVKKVLSIYKYMSLSIHV